MKVDGSTFVTVSGNFKVTTENMDMSSIENVVTKFDGFDVTHLLQNLAFTREKDLKNLVTEYTLYRQRYPELLPELPTNATATIITQTIQDLNKKLNGNLTLLKPSDLSLTDVSKSQAKVGDIVNLAEEKKVEEKKPDEN